MFSSIKNFSNGLPCTLENVCVCCSYWIIGIEVLPDEVFNGQGWLFVKAVDKSDYKTTTVSVTIHGKVFETWEIGVDVVFKTGEVMFILEYWGRTTKYNPVLEVYACWTAD